MKTPFPKLGAGIAKVFKPFKPVLLAFRFLKLSYLSLIILLFLFAAAMIFQVVTMTSLCRISQDLTTLQCDDTTITGLPFWQNTLIAFAGSYLIASLAVLTYNKLFKKSIFYK